MIWDTFANGHTCMFSNNSLRWHCSLSGEWLSWQRGGGVANKQYLLHNQCTVNLPSLHKQQQQPKINTHSTIHCTVNLLPFHKQQAKATAKKQYLLHNQCTVNLPTSNNQQPKSNTCSIHCVQSIWQRCTSNKQKQQPISNTNIPYLYSQRANVVSETSKSNNQKPILTL